MSERVQIQKHYEGATAVSNVPTRPIHGAVCTLRARTNDLTAVIDQLAERLHPILSLDSPQEVPSNPDLKPERYSCDLEKELRNSDDSIERSVWWLHSILNRLQL